MKPRESITAQARPVFSPLRPGEGRGERGLRKTLRSRIPFTTLSVTIATLLASASSLGPSLQYDRELFAHQPWRILACHFTHWSFNHLAWSLAAFMVLGLLCEARDRLRYIVCLLASAMLIPLTLQILQPSLRTYRGLSGIDSALFFLAAIPLARDLWRDYRPFSIAACLLLIGFFGKVAFEAMTGRAAFAHSDGAFVPVPLAHLAGAMIGTACVVPRKMTGGGAARLSSMAGVGVIRRSP